VTVSANYSTVGNAQVGPGVNIGEPRFLNAYSRSAALAVVMMR
jgi:hypothetical protein